MTTIHDVAKKSGYSVSTVSRVLNQKNHVSEKARQSIEKAIKSLDYVPNDIARDLSHGKNYHIGVVLPHTKHPYFTEILNGMIDRAFSTMYRIVILPSEYDEKIEIEYLEQLRRKSFDALIFTSRGITLDKLAEYTKYGPIVCCENPQRADLQAVYVNRKRAYYEAFQWLKSKEKTQIVLILSRDYQSSVTSQAVLDTYQAVFGFYPKKEQIISGITSYAHGFQVGNRLIEDYPQVDGLFTNVDDVAAGLRMAYQEKRQTSPLIIGQGNQLSSQLLHFSTIDHHLREIGHRSFEMAIESSKEQQVELDSQFMIRE